MLSVTPLRLIFFGVVLCLVAAPDAPPMAHGDDHGGEDEVPRR